MMMVVAIDFDGTLFEDAFPEIGAPKQEVLDWVKQRKALGDKFILWTCREGKHLTDAVSACLRYGIVFDAINANVEEKLQKYGDDSRKVGADLYVDDKSCRPWEIFKEVK